MVDSNKSYCLRLASITFPLLGTKPASTAASMPQQKARLSISEPALPATAPVSVREELTVLFGDACNAPTLCLESPENLALALQSRPDVQSRLGIITQYTPSKWLLEREMEACGHWPQPKPAPGQPDLPLQPDGKPDAFDAARRRSAIGLCLSGGGIRSATFNLGILQALSRHQRIGKLDYLSSVSGGGYIHQFLANWIFRADSVQTVENLLNPIPNSPGASPLGYRATVQPEPISWLRRYSNYLAPRRGAFSLDSWTIVAVWTRNTLLNLVVLFASLFFILLLPHFGTMLYLPLEGDHRISYVLSSLLLLVYVAIAVMLYRWLVDVQLPGPPAVFVKLTCVALFIASSLIAPRIYKSSLPGGSSISSAATQVFTPITHPEELHYKSTYTRQTASSEVLSVSVDSREPEPSSRLRAHWDARPRPLWHYISAQRSHAFLLVFLVLCALFITAVAAAASKLPGVFVPVFFLFGLLVSYLLVEGVRLLFFILAFALPPHLIAPLGVVLMPALIFGIPFLTVEAGVGLIGRGADSAQREWLARSRAFSFLFGGAWLALSSFSLLGPAVFDLLADYTRTGYTVLAGWAATSIAGAFSARSGETAHGPAGATDDPSRGSSILEFIAKIAPPVFVCGLLILISKLVTWSLVVSTGGGSRHVRFAILALSSLATAILFGWRVDINDFSMHTFYRDRLARCYAGASNPNRSPNRFTGFTRDDRDLRMDQLLPAGYEVKDEFGQSMVNRSGKLRAGSYKGPFPIICTSINLTMGEDLAYQERKASSFAFTPLFSGFNVGWTSASDSRNQFNGFVDTHRYVYTKEKGLMVATAVAISGAAASPNMGYHSSPAVAFLLTVFNVRLGWWLRNPRRRRIGLTTTAPQPPEPVHADPLAPPHPPVKATHTGPLPSSPRFGLLKLLTELLGRSNDTTSYVYLTDGGHFDNMGLYELLRRRCRTIIICDGEADSHLRFEGIGMAIRKARLDFGIEITLDSIQPIPAEPAPAASSQPQAPSPNQISSSAEPAAPGSSIPLSAAAAPAQFRQPIPPALQPNTPPATSGPAAGESKLGSPSIPSSAYPEPSPEGAIAPAQTATDKEMRTTDPASPTVRQPQPTAESPFVLSAHISSTDASEVTGTISRHTSPEPIIEGLSSFAAFPGNTVHCVHGTIRYPEDTDSAQFGRILYIKASLTGDEPPDVLNYRRQHDNFPHDTTLNQFFTESQFESYRRLGEHILLTDKTAISWLDRYL